MSTRRRVGFKTWQELDQYKKMIDGMMKCLHEKLEECHKKKNQWKKDPENRRKPQIECYYYRLEDAYIAVINRLYVSKHSALGPCDVRERRIYSAFRNLSLAACRD